MMDASLDKRLMALDDAQLLDILNNQDVYRDEVINHARRAIQERGLVARFPDAEFKVITAGGRENGPLDVLLIKDLYLRGVIKPESLVHVASRGQWLSLSQVFDVSRWNPEDNVLLGRVQGEQHLTSAPDADKEARRPLPASEIGARKQETEVVASQPAEHQSDNTESSATGPSGVGGFLVLFIIGQLVCRPLSTCSEFIDMQRINMAQILDRFPTTAFMLNVEKMVLVAMAIFGVVVAFALMNTGTPLPVKLAKIYLIVNAAAAVILSVMYGGSDLPNEIRGNTVAYGLGRAIGTAVWCGLWFLYFTFSKRVKATYLADSDIYGEGSVGDGITTIGLGR